MTRLDLPLRLLPRVRNYDWGTADFIPRLCGRAPTGGPEAELWFGSHPDAPADVVLGPDETEAMPLDRLIAERPVEVLGRDAALPFLTKILSAGRPLSIQAHPSRDQAARGFAAETGGACSYRDPNHKPELLYALTPFSALSGFRQPAEAAGLLDALALPELAPHVQRLQTAGAAAYRPLLAMLSGHAGTGLADRVIRAAARAAENDASLKERDALRRIPRIAALHPGDPLAIAPLFLRLIQLEPGQALFVGPGVLHSYLEGSGVEVMASSDNVLRLGLTSKPVDADALLDILVYETARPAHLAPTVKEGPWGRRTAFTPPVADFRLDVLDLSGRTSAPLPADRCLRIALALDGEVEIRNRVGGRRLRPGQAALLTAAAGSTSAAGPGTVALTMPNRGIADCAASSRRHSLR